MVNGLVGYWPVYWDEYPEDGLGPYWEEDAV
eukprot:CAMPEP_0184672030 /NCGR_PEP_ID=MMETSP0308-20130426/85857_1 /TAXON_ID=38269 /ORGANISM="Gloeochaete witrockiana, Strain SAG 46.84" /LENGTH=30 /DNA_ID= /DNA_START= /DNA_END= /DNA_ORIENTATION=